MSGFMKNLQKISFIIIILMSCYLLASVLKVTTEGSSLLISSQICRKVRNEIGKGIVEKYFPGFSFAMGERAQEIPNPEQYLAMAIGDSFPIYTYITKQPEYKTDIESSIYYDVIIAREANDESYIDSTTGKLVSDETNTQSAENTETSSQTQENSPVENHVVETPQQTAISVDKLNDFDYLISNFYTVDKTTTITSSELNAGELLSKDMTLKTGNDSPQILIYHTHSQEGYVDSVASDPSTRVVGVGERLAELLRTKYGLNVIHHTGEYDVESRDYAYSNAAPDIQAILADNPSIEVVIDLHRDGVPDTTRLVTSVNGKDTAKIMFFNGLSKTTSTGAIDYLYNPYINDNLAMSLKMKLAAEQYYPGFTRKIFLKGYRYNMHFKPKCMLIEVGAQTNTLAEAMNAMEPLADIFSKVLTPK